MPSTMLLQYAAVDADFRDVLTTGTFPVAVDALPAPVEQPDQASLDFWTEGVAALEIYACRNSCSWGPFTAICDGDTK